MQEKVKEAVHLVEGGIALRALSGLWTSRRAKKLRRKQPTKQFQAQGTVIQLLRQANSSAAT